MDKLKSAVRKPSLETGKVSHDVRKEVLDCPHDSIFEGEMLLICKACGASKWNTTSLVAPSTRALFENFYLKGRR